ncbi:MAG TPA: PIN domain-containing protein [Pyrinomonadaceae bacterium]|jgi:PIN domain nuclease of toxin-antitoxin system|nr:PIN domain-containing protein [Pyrinomonadaceae bacterium]
MAIKYILDTHALIWHLEGNRLLGSNARSIIDNPQSQLILPVIGLAEAMFIVEKGRTAIPAVSDLMHDVANDPRIDVFPLTLGILDESAALTSVPEIHDRLIVATGVYLQKLGDHVEILTKDNEIIVSSILPVCW